MNRVTRGLVLSSFFVAAPMSAAEPMYVASASAVSAVTNPCAQEKGKARDVCIQKSKRDSVVDYILISSSSSGSAASCKYVVHKPTAYERCRAVAVSCDTPMANIINKATRINTWYSAQMVANLCEKEHADGCSTLTGKCTVHIFVPVEIRDNDAKTLALSPSQIGFYVQQPIWSLLFPKGQ